MHYFTKKENSNIVEIKIDLPNNTTDTVTRVNITNYKIEVEGWEMVERIINALND